jgi:Fe2+ transport system protein B
MKHTLIILSAFVLFGCASRKVNSTEVKETTEVKAVETETLKEEIKKESETNTKVVTDIKIDTEKNVVTEVTEITPEDKTKPASVKLPNGQIIDITNAKYRHEKKTDLSKEKKSYLSEYQQTKKDLENALKTIKKDKETIAKLTRQLKDKETKSERGFPWWILILITIFFLLIYIRFKRK